MADQKFVQNVPVSPSIPSVGKETMSETLGVNRSFEQISSLKSTELKPPTEAITEYNTANNRPHNAEIISSIQNQSEKEASRLDKLPEISPEHKESNKHTIEVNVKPSSGEIALNQDIAKGGASSLRHLNVGQVLKHISGYQAAGYLVNDNNFPAQIQNTAQTGDPNTSDTWQASLLLKILTVFFNIFK